MTNDDIAAKTKQINTLEGEIQALVTAIEDPETGLKAMIKRDEETLQANYESQVTETSERKEENAAYQKDALRLPAGQTRLAGSKTPTQDLAKRCEAGCPRWHSDSCGTPAIRSVAQRRST